MKKQNGFATSTILLAIFIVFLFFMVFILAILQSRHLMLEKVKNDVGNEINKVPPPEIGPFDFSYTGNIQEFIVPETGYYKLETWGAEGGAATTSDESWKAKGGYGSYSVGYVHLIKNQKLYIGVGGKGEDSVYGTIKSYEGGFNGGGNGYVSRITTGNNTAAGAGGGATHISKNNRGTLDGFKDYVSELIIVAGGGGGGHTDIDRAGSSANGGNGGGHLGTSTVPFVGTSGCSHNCDTNRPQGGSQTEGGTGINPYNPGTVVTVSPWIGEFGKGGTNDTTSSGGGGGGGFYGGGTGQWNGGAGGSGYIGNNLLTNGLMVCYNCEVSYEPSTLTDTIDEKYETPTSEFPKSGNGHARISYYKTEPDANEYAIEISNVIGGLVTSSKSKALYGEEITLTLTPQSGYLLDSLNFSSNKVAAGSTTFIMPRENVTITPVWKPASVTMIDGGAFPSGSPLSGSSACSCYAYGAGQSCNVTCTVGGTIDLTLYNNIYWHLVSSDWGAWRATHASNHDGYLYLVNASTGAAITLGRAYDSKNGLNNVSPSGNYNVSGLTGNYYFRLTMNAGNHNIYIDETWGGEPYVTGHISINTLIAN